MYIFGIGFHRTGTRSLAEAFKILGYNVWHGGIDKEISRILQDNKNNKKKLLDGVDNYNVWLDQQEISWYFKDLDKQYSNKKFIFNWRDLDGRIESKKKLCRSHNREFDVENWKKYYYKYIKRVKKYFRNRDDILFLNICGGEGWEKLLPFLGFEYNENYFSFPYKR